MFPPVPPPPPFGPGPAPYGAPPRPVPLPPPHPVLYAPDAYAREETDAKDAATLAAAKAYAMETAEAFADAAAQKAFSAVEEAVAESSAAAQSAAASAQEAATEAAASAQSIRTSLASPDGTNTLSVTDAGAVALEGETERTINVSLDGDIYAMHRHVLVNEAVAGRIVLWTPDNTKLPEWGYPSGYFGLEMKEADGRVMVFFYKDGISRGYYGLYFNAAGDYLGPIYDSTKDAFSVTGGPVSSRVLTSRVLRNAVRDCTTLDSLLAVLKNLPDS